MSAGLTTASVRSSDSRASAVIAGWPVDRPFSVDAVLDEQPELSGHQSVLIDLAYEEFCRLEESGRKVAPSVFIGRFPQIERPLRRVLQLHDLCNNTPEVRDVLLGERWPAAGSELTGYRLIEEIGRGAASRVFIAEDLELASRKVVVKVGRSRQEAAALGALQHPHIVPVLAARTDDATDFSVLCMPWLGRATLDAVIDRLFEKGAPRAAGDLSRAVQATVGFESIAAGRTQGTFGSAVAGLGRDLAAALAHAHARGIVHSDVKPSNVLLTEDGTPMLLDFNLARREGDEHLFNRGGTLPYMPPEQLARWQEADSASPEADVFSLGVTLYELLTGMLPFGTLEPGDLAAAARQLAERHTHGPGPLPAGRLQGNRRLGELIDDCLAADPADRPSAERLSKELAATLRPAAVARQSLRVHRREVLIALAAGLGLAATGAGAVAFRTPRVDREWESGLAATDLGRFEEAVTHFDYVVSERPDDAAALVARGWSLLQTGEPHRALADLRQAYEQQPTGNIAALLGYAVLLSTGDLGYAKTNFGKAILDGYDTAAVRNNAGYCYLQAAEFTSANVHLRSAVRIDPDCGAAHHNLALLDLREAIAEERAPDLGIIERALDVSSPSPGLFLDAACVFAAACESGGDFEEAVLRNCESAISLGIDREECLATVRSYYPELTDSMRSVDREVTADRVSKHDLQVARIVSPLNDLRRFFAAEVDLP